MHIAQRHLANHATVVSPAPYFLEGYCPCLRLDMASADVRRQEQRLEDRTGDIVYRVGGSGGHR